MLSSKQYMLNKYTLHLTLHLVKAGEVALNHEVVVVPVKDRFVNNLCNINIRIS